jgi:hypothetical protein
MRYSYLTGKQNVLTRLGHRTIGRTHNKDRTVHLRRSRDHVLHVVSVTWTVNMSVMTVRRLVLYVSRSDRNSTLTLLRRLVDLVKRYELRFVIAAVSVVLP